MNEWNVGVYIRLSQEDGDKEESNSVINQRELINNYIEEDVSLKVYDYYIDDGWSGTNFDRPNFKRLITDIEKQIVNTVIVKDLSRFGRNYIEVGNYLEQMFPINNVRFIAINDYIDSYKDPESINSIIVPFKNLMNDEYCRDISQKVKYALNTRKKNGEYMGAMTPYGYIKSKEDKHKLIVDEEAAKVIKRIFKLALKGYGTTSIARKLNEDNVYTPSMHKILELKENFKFRNNGERNYWSDSNVSSILRNRVYIGEMIQCKYKTISYKISKRVKTNDEDRIIVKGTHEAIISEKDFDKVQKLLDSRAWKITTEGVISKFAGKIKCADCNAYMMRNKSGKRKSDGKYPIHYYCSTYMRKSKKLCTRHSFEESNLENVVLKVIKQQIDLIIDKEKIIKDIYLENKKLSKKGQYREKVQELKDELYKLDVLKREAYLDWKKELINQNDYFSFVEGYSKKINELNNEISKYEQIIDGIKDESIDEYIGKFKQFNNIKELDREVIDELIETIYVYEDKKINIVFKYNDIYKKLLEFIKKGEELNGQVNI